MALKEAHHALESNIVLWTKLSKAIKAREFVLNDTAIGGFLTGCHNGTRRCRTIATSRPLPDGV
jgi:hypothetical protein